MGFTSLGSQYLIFSLNLALIHLVLIQVRIDDKNFSQDTLKISNRDNGGDTPQYLRAVLMLAQPSKIY